MKILKAIYRFLRALFGTAPFVQTGIDSHRWETKMEVMQRLSSHHG